MRVRPGAPVKASPYQAEAAGQQAGATPAAAEAKQ